MVHQSGITVTTKARGLGVCGPALAKTRRQCTIYLSLSLSLPSYSQIPGCHDHTGATLLALTLVKQIFMDSIQYNGSIIVAILACGNSSIASFVGPAHATVAMDCKAPITHFLRVDGSMAPVFAAYHPKFHDIGCYFDDWVRSH